jgi:hypothetical protein
MSTPTKAEATPRKPLLFADERSEAEKFDPMLHRGHLDPSRIPGYSEIVMANDISRADDLVFRSANGVTKEDMYRKIGATPRVLDVEFAWLPISGAGGAPSELQTRALDGYLHQEGYRLASKEDLTSRGFGMPPLGRESEDGTIRRGADVALFVRSGEVSRKWNAYKIAEQAELEGRQVALFTSGRYEAEAFSGVEDEMSVTIRN